MRKRTVLSIFVALALSMTALSGCTGGFNGGKEVITVSIYNGGLGTDWINGVVNKFNAENENYRVATTKNKYGVAHIESELASGNPFADVFVTCEPNLKRMIERGLLADISDVYEMPAEENGKKIKDKIKNLELYTDILSDKSTGKIYGLPHSDALMGFLFDYQLFKDKGWLILDSDGTPSAGKDGKKGTYDDGQPQTLQEWDRMVKLIGASGAKPFIWGGEVATYTDQIAESALVQYLGLENYRVINTFSGTLTSPSNSASVNIVPAEGFKVYENEGFKVALNFLDQYLGNENYLHPAATGRYVGHRDAQDRFILGYKNESENPLSALLVDGNYWENEARVMFNAVAETDASRAYGKREYRYMLLPALDKQLGIDGEGNGSVMVSRDNGVICCGKQSDPEKLAAIKQFLAMLTSDSVTKDYMNLTNSLRPYEVTMSESDLAKLTPLGRNVWEMYNDSENIAIIRPYSEALLSPLYYKTDKISTMFAASFEGALTYTAIMGLERKSVDEYWSGIRTQNSAAVWAQYMSACEGLI